MSKLKGLRTILVARIYTLVGALIAAYDFSADYVHSIGGFDLTPIIPERYRLYIPGALMLTGMVFEGLRRATTTPVGVNPQAPQPPVNPAASDAQKS